MHAKLIKRSGLHKILQTNDSTIIGTSAAVNRNDMVQGIQEWAK